jgi:hypothetical protein
MEERKKSKNLGEVTVGEPEICIKTFEEEPGSDGGCESDW